MWTPTGQVISSRFTSVIDDQRNSNSTDNFRLIAINAIPADTFSIDIELHNLIKKPSHNDVCIRLNNSGRIEPVSLSIKSWIRSATLAEDCHSVNARLQRGRRKDSVMIRTVRDILPGEQIKLWFSEEILALLRIPSFLLPSNIQGNRKYVCNNCNLTFEEPNPLKIHLALNCNREESIQNLWLRLIPEEEKKPIINISPTSAFSPWTPKLPSLILPSATTPIDLSAHHARMESIVSSLGRSKKGHVCLYCGKLYSRKYGLKIHIRTHTGYKPLSCKYCLRPFGDPSNLNKHVRLHAAGDTPYKCDLCGKILVRRRDLERHLKARHNTVISPSL